LDCIHPITTIGTAKRPIGDTKDLKTGFEGLAVGNRLRVQLVSTDVERGYIDFRRV